MRIRRETVRGFEANEIDKEIEFIAKFNLIFLSSLIEIKICSSLPLSGHFLVFHRKTCRFAVAAKRKKNPNDEARRDHYERGLM